MDKAKLEELRGIAEQRCNELFKQSQDIFAELERTRGDYRTYDSLLLNWIDNEVKEAEVVSPKKEKDKA